MSMDMKPMPPSLERPRDGAEQEVKPREPAVSTTQARGGEGTEISSVTKILRDHEMKELEEIFVALEEDRRHLQSLLLQQREEHEVRLSTLEREMIQERLDWEREMRNREEALRSALMAVAIGRGKLMSDLRSHMEKQSWAFLLRPAPYPAGKVEQPKNLWCCKTTSPVQSTSDLGEADGKLNQERQSRTWWGFKKRQTTAVAVQDVSTSSASKEADLLKIAKLEERIRKAELQKQQKASKKAAKAEKKAKKVEEKAAKKMEKKAKKEAKEAEKRAQKEAKEAEKRAQKEAKKAEKAGKKAQETSLQE